MRSYAPLVATIGVVAMFPIMSAPTQGQSARNATPRLVAELFDGRDGALTLDVSFHGARPEPDKADETLRHLLTAVTVVHPGKDITARAWYRVSADSSDRQTVTLAGGAASLLYVAKDKVIRSNQDGAAASGEGATGETGSAVLLVSLPGDASDDVSTIVENGRVVKACREFPQAQLAVLAGVGLEKRGEARKVIVKAMRSWCKKNEIATSRKVSLCMSAVSKAVLAMKSEPSVSPEDLAAAIARGKTSFTGSNRCTNCHQAGGGGGPRGPDLTDAQWIHCDGSIEGIKKVILDGVPQNKVKNSSFPSMRPTTNLVGNDEELTDLATYIHSLSQN